MAHMANNPFPFGIDENTKNIIQIVLKILCSGQSPKLLQHLTNDLCRFSDGKYNLTGRALCDLLKGFPGNFTLTRSDKHRDIIVTAITKLGLCDAHCANRAVCNIPLCDGLHICKFYLLSNSCRFSQDNRCLYGHDLTSAHNKRLLRENYLDHLTVAELKYLFQNVENRSTTTLPKVCKFYNVSGGCRNQQMGKPCPFMHICKFYLLGQCSFGQNCKRNHNVFESQVKYVLLKHGINVQRSPKEVLAELRTVGVGDAGNDRMSDYSAASERGFAMPPIRRAPGSPHIADGPRWRSVPSLDQVSPYTFPVDFSSTDDEDNSDDVIVESDDSSDDSCRGGATGGILRPADTRKGLASNNKISQKTDSLDICIYHLRNKCAFGHSCRKQHKDMPYQWQFQCMGESSWTDFQQQQNIDIELNYCDVTKTTCYTELRPGEIALLDFVKQEAQPSKRHPLKIRRLSTSSSSVEKYQPLATDWRWYWLNQENKWCGYGEKDAAGYRAEVDSADLEQNYVEMQTGQMRFATVQFEYLMDFQRMEQVNTGTKMSRPVRRRPVFVDLKETAKRKKRSAEMDPHMQGRMAASCIPAEWDLDRRLSSDQTIIDHFNRVKIYESDPKTKDEYRKVKELFCMSMPSSRITSIERVENGELWMNFVSKKEKMKRKKKSGGLNERRLFHGTYHRYVDAICRQGFDFRFSGKSVGTKYGKGSYFSKSSMYADSYTDSSKEMFVVLVLAGDTVKGESSFVRPPPKNPRDPHELYDSCVDDVRSPNIYVIFTFDQVYPQYVIKYKN